LGGEKEKRKGKGIRRPGPAYRWLRTNLFALKKRKGGKKENRMAGDWATKGRPRSLSAPRKKGGEREGKKGKGHSDCHLNGWAGSFPIEKKREKKKEGKEEKAVEGEHGNPDLLLGEKKKERKIREKKEREERGEKGKLLVGKRFHHRNAPLLSPFPLLAERKKEKKRGRKKSVMQASEPYNLNQVRHRHLTSS